jgi:hypothetical protein
MLTGLDALTIELGAPAMYELVLSHIDVGARRPTNVMQVIVFHVVYSTQSSIHLREKSPARVLNPTLPSICSQ